MKGRKCRLKRKNVGTTLVSHQIRLDQLDIIWEGMAEELGDLQVFGVQEWESPTRRPVQSSHY